MVVVLTGSRSSGGQKPEHSSLTEDRFHHRVAMRLVGSNPNPRISGVGRLPGITNYFVGRDPAGWTTGIRSYSSVRYANVYQAIDAVYKDSRGVLEYDFIVEPGGDPDSIKLGFSGARPVKSQDGDLLLRTRAGLVRQHKPVAYQEIGGRRRRVLARFDLLGGRRVGLSVGRYDPSSPLVIDPKVVYSSYLGGIGFDSGYGIATDGAGNAYVTGVTGSADFPGAVGNGGAYQGAGDVFVTKLDTNGTPIYSTYLGGNGGDAGTDIQTDLGGNAYITGSSASPDFPTRNAFDPSFGGGQCKDPGYPTQVPCSDAFLTKLAPDGALAYSSYLGGGANDVGYGIAVGEPGNAYVTGSTQSADFPASSGAYQQTLQGGGDAFVAALDTTLAGISSRIYATYLGGSSGGGCSDIKCIDISKTLKRLNDPASAANPPADSEAGVAIDTDSAGRAYVTGSTNSPNFPKTPGSYGSGSTCKRRFVTKLGPGGSLLFSTCGIGGGSIAVDLLGRAYIGIGSGASDASTTGDALQRTHNGNGDGFVSQLDASGAGLIYSTYLGGSGHDEIIDLAIDEAGVVHVTGATTSADFPVTPGALQSGAGGGLDAFITSFRPGAGSAGLIFSTFSGGVGNDIGFSIAAQTEGAVVTGSTWSPDFPWAAPSQSDFAGSIDSFVLKVSTSSAAGPEVTSVTPRSSPSSGGAEIVISGRAFTGADAVMFGEVPAEDFRVDSDTQITAVSPPSSQLRSAVTVRVGQERSTPHFFSRFHWGEGSWRPSGSPGVQLWGHTATLLDDGRVLVAGGSSVAGQVASQGLPVAQSHLYDPVTESWRSTKGSLQQARFGHTADLLPNGRVLVAGGCCDGTGKALKSAEIFDPATETWTRTADMVHGVTSAASVLLRGSPGDCGVNCGRVLVAGGYDPSPLSTTPGNTAQLYDPTLGIWRATGSSAGGGYRTATLLEAPSRDACSPGCGRVLFVGGSSIPGAETYNPLTESWSATKEDLGILRGAHAATLLRTGKVLVEGGVPGGSGIGLASAELYDPTTDEWTPANPLRTPRFNHSSVLLPNGKVLVTGGYGLSDAEVYGPDGEWRSAGSVQTSGGEGLGRPTAILLSSSTDGFEADASVCGANCGKVLVLGASRDTNAQLYTPAPSVTGVSPGSGAAEGGTSVTISGMGFTNGVKAVTFGGVPALSFHVDAYDRMSAVAPPAAGSATPRVAVITEGGESAENVTFTYTGFPGSINDLEARALSGEEIRLTFSAPAEVGGLPGPAGRYVIKQAGAPITDQRAWDEAKTLCGGECAFSPRDVGDRITQFVTGLRPETTYYYAIRPRGPGGQLGPLSNPAEVTTGLVTPGRVDDLRATAVSGSEIKLTFSASGSNGTSPPPVGSYVVKQSKSPISDEEGFDHARALCGGVCNFSVGRVGTKITLSVTGLQARTRYHYALRPKDDAGNFGGLSNLVDVRTLATTPQKVADLSARALGARRIKLTFSAPSDGGARPAPVRAYLIRQARRPIRGIKGFNRGHKLCKGICKFAPAKVGDRITFTVTHLTPGTRYFYAVRTKDGRSLGPISKSVRARTRDAPRTL